MRRKRSKKHRRTRLPKNTAKALVLSIAAAPIIMAMPVTGEASVTLQDIPQVEQHMDDYLAQELGGNLVVGDSITIDLDDIFVDAEELYYTVITYNSNVAGVTLLSGELHGNLQIKAMQTGSTMVQLIARTTEFGTPVYEQFRLSVASIPDIGDEGIDIADIVSYMYTNPGRLTSLTGVKQLLQNINWVFPPVNMGPTTSDGSFEVNLAVDGQIVLDMEDFFSDPDGDELEYSLLLSSANVISGVDLDGDQLTIHGSTNATVLTVEAREKEITGHAKVSKNFNITISNDAPVGTDDTYTIDEDGILSTGNVLDNDTDADGDALTAMKGSYPSNGTLELLSDGTFTYTPHPNFNGTDSFSYKVNDGTTDSEVVNVVITVTAVNDAVVVSNLIVAQTADEDTPFTFVVPENTFYDAETATLFYEAATLSDGSVLPSWLSFNGPSRTFTGTPSNEDVGEITVRVRVTDGQYSAYSDFNITVNNTNDAPVGTEDTYTIDEDGILSTGNVLDNDTDADGDALTAMKGSYPSNGTLELLSDGTFTYTPHPNFHGTDSFSYKVYDGTAYSNAVDVVITVTAVNDAVVVSNSIVAQTADKDTPFTFVVPENTFYDAETATLFYEAATLSNGSVLPSWLSFNGPSRTFTGTPSNEDVGMITVRVRVTDGQYSAYSDFNITVNEVSDAPKALFESVDVTLYNNQNIEIDISQYFTDEEDSPLNITYQINGILKDHQLISYNSGSLILTVGHSGTFSSDSTLSISFYADDVTDSHSPTLSTIHVNYKAQNTPSGYLYVDSQQTYDLASFYTFPDYKNNELANITFTPKDENETQITGVSIDAQGILSVADALDGDFRYVVVEARDNHGATILSTIRVVVDKEIRIKEDAPTTFYGGREGDVYFGIDLTDIFDTEGTYFTTYYFDGEPYYYSNLNLSEEYENLPMTKTIQALDFYGNIVSYDIILDYNNQPTISYNNYGTDKPAIAIGLEIGASSASLFDASHYAYDEDGDSLIYELVTTDAIHLGAITDPIQNGGEFLLQGTTKGKLDYELNVIDPLGSYSYMPVEIYVVDKVVKLNTGENSYDIALTDITTALGLDNPIYDIPSISNPGVVETATIDGGTLTLLDASVYGGTTLITIPTMHEDGLTNILIFVEVDLNKAPEAAYDMDWYPALDINRGNALIFDLTTLFEDSDGDDIEEYRIVNAPDEADLGLSLEGDQLHISSLNTENYYSWTQYFSIEVEARDAYGAWSTYPIAIYVGVVPNIALSQTITLSTAQVDSSIFLPDYLGYNYFDGELNSFDVMSDNTDVVIANLSMDGNTVNLEGVGVGTAYITLIGDTEHGAIIYHKLLVEVIHPFPVFTDPGTIKINIETASGGLHYVSSTPTYYDLSTMFNDEEVGELEYSINYDENAIAINGTLTNGTWFSNPEIVITTNKFVDTSFTVFARIQAQPSSYTSGNVVSVQTTNAPVASIQDEGTYMTFMRPDDNVTFDAASIPQFPFYDIDGDVVKYSAAVIGGTGGVTITPNGDTFDIYGKASGEVTLQITADDGGLLVTGVYTLLVLAEDEYALIGEINNSITVMDLGLLLVGPISVMDPPESLSVSFDEVGDKLTITNVLDTYTVNYSTYGDGKYIISIMNSSEESASIVLYIIPTVNPE